MSATFACPHCGATYPRKPVLVGRTVRCTTCKNAFKLREDGIADKVEAAAAPSEPPPPAPAPAPTPPQAKPPTPAAKPALIPLTLPPELAAAPPVRSAKPAADLDLDVEVIEPPAPPAKAPAKAPTAAAKPSGSATQPASRASDRLTVQQQEARRAMAATLSDSMSAALKAESVKREVEAEEKSKKQASTAEGRVGKIGPAVLTGEGLQQARLRRTWYLAGLALIALFGGCSWLVVHRSPERAAIEGYAAVVEGPRNRYERIQAIQERAWLVALPPAFVGVPAMMDMSDARIGGPRTIKLAPAKALFEQVKGLVLSERLPVWVTKERAGTLEALLRPGLSERDQVASVVRADKRILSYHDWQDQLVAVGLTKEDTDILDLLLRGKTKRSGENELAGRLLAGDLPDALQVAPFAGRKGLMVVSRGQSYEPKTVHYEGRLLRFVGKDWPIEWKVLTISTTLIPE